MATARQLPVNQMNLFHSISKWQKSVKTVKDIVTSLKQAMQMARLGNFVVPSRPQIATTLAAKPNPSYSIARRIKVPTSLEWQYPVEHVFVCCSGFWKILA
jgi:thiamine pyrophosphate-dependent acetolactate synthase large subunit-like protein